MYSLNLPNTIGIEVEGISIPRNSITNFMDYNEDPAKSKIKSITRDASVEGISRYVHRNVSLFLGNSFLRKSMRPRGEDSVIGYEIVTHPLERTEMSTTVLKITNALTMNGEIFSPRSSVHVHTGFPYGLVFLKGAVALGLKIEPLMFKLAGMGRDYRGSINKSAYARPLISPPAIRCAEDDSYLVLSPKDSLLERNSEAFWKHFGIYETQSDRYVPLRYFGINIYSVLLRGTMEYRFFNYTSNPNYINAVSELCQLSSDIMIRASLQSINSLPSIDIHEANSDGSYMSLLDDIIEMGNYYKSDLVPSADSIDNLKDILATTPQPVFDRGVVKTHLENYRMSSREWPELKSVDSPVSPGTVNIHNFGNSNRTLI